MSAINEYIIERQNEQQELKLASLLGITIDELSNLNYDIYDDEGHDGGQKHIHHGFQSGKERCQDCGAFILAQM